MASTHGPRRAAGFTGTGRLLFGLAAGILLLSAPARAAKVERSPLGIGTALDIGQVVKGINMVNPAAIDTIEGMMIQRTAVYLNQVTTIDDRLVISVGVGGLFFYGYPEIKTNAQSRSIRFGPGVGQASGLYKFGDIEKPAATVQFGYFPYKYNPDAKNLGEFLFRSGTYPGYEITGGWSIMNSANYMASGLRVNSTSMDGALSLDANLFLEKDLEPIYDLSPGLVATYKAGDAFEAGIGAAFAHLVPVNPSKLKSRTHTYMGDTLFRYDGVIRPDSTALRYTFKGTKVMGRASFNLGAILDNRFIGKDGLKFYGEAALLGVKDYPYFFEDKMARLPILLGLNLPTFGFFDAFAVEMVYRKRDFPNSTKIVAKDNDAVWRIPTVTVRDTSGRALNQPDKFVDVTDPHLYSPGLSQAEAAKKAQDYINQFDPTTLTGGVGVQGILADPAQTVPSKDGNLKWTMYMKKEVASGVSAYLQVASDHMRGIRFEDNTLDHEVLTPTPKDWYYLFRLEFGI